MIVSDGGDGDECLNWQVQDLFHTLEDFEVGMRNA